LIPVRLDSGETIAGLQEIADQGRRAGSEVKQGFDEARAGAGGLNEEMAGLLKARFGLPAVGEIAGVVNAQLREVGEYARKTAQHFVDVQKAMQGVAALAGKSNTNHATLEEARMRAAANLEPGKSTQFRDAFQSKASHFVGDKPGSKMSEGDGVKFQRSMAEHAAVHCVSAVDMADFAVGLLAQAQGPTTAEAMKAKAAAVFRDLTASSAPVRHSLPGVTRAMAEGFRSEVAAPALAMAPDVAPGEETARLLRLVAEGRRLNLEGRGADYAVSKDMSPQQQLEALVGNPGQRSERGEDLDTLVRGVTHEGIAGDALRGLGRQGPGGFDQWKGIRADAADSAVAADIANGRESEAWQQMRFERGSMQAAREQLTKNAEPLLVKERPFDKRRHEDHFLRQPAALGSEQRQFVPGANQPAADSTVPKLLERQNQLLERQNQLLERQTRLAEEDARGRGNRPLVADPPRPSGRM